MNHPAQHAVYRLQTADRKSGQSKNYQGSYRLIDDSTGQTAACCDLFGRAIFTEQGILDREGCSWVMKPNRKLMPNRWAISDQQNEIAMIFDQKLLGKLTNPLYRVALMLFDRNSNERYRLVNAEDSLPDWVFGVGPKEWALLAGEQPKAKLVRLPRPGNPGKGLIGQLQKLLRGTDPGIISAGSEHELPGPTALALLLLFRELTDVSGG